MCSLLPFGLNPIHPNTMFFLNHVHMASGYSAFILEAYIDFAPHPGCLSLEIIFYRGWFVARYLSSIPKLKFE